jgi:hypothetical protein
MNQEQEYWSWPSKSATSSGRVKNVLTREVDLSLIHAGRVRSGIRGSEVLAG